MNRKKRVLIFPCGSEVGLEIWNSLKWSTHFELFGGSSVADHGKFVFSNYNQNFPFIDKPEFIPYLKSYLRKEQIDFIFPAHDSVVLKVSQESDNLPVKIIGSPKITCEICRSKRSTYEFFNNFLRVPHLYLKTSKIEYPVFLKPEVGQGSKGTHLAKNRRDIDFYLNLDSSLLILEYLPGKEYTVDCFTDKKGVLRYAAGRERVRINNGISVNSKFINEKQNMFFSEMAKIINSKLRFRGAWFFQVKKSFNKELVLMEIAPRIAGTMGINRGRGINLPLLSLFDAMDMDVEIPKPRLNVEVDRALVSRYKVGLDYNKVYIDLDDTLVRDNQVNSLMMAFVFQCLNRKIKIILITRHGAKENDNTGKFLSNFRLKQLFTEIIEVPNRSSKHEFINPEKSIFIDDSFIERNVVFLNLGIPVFDTHSIEVLLDNRS